MRYVDGDGDEWLLEERQRFGSEISDTEIRIYTSAVVVVRRPGKWGGVWMRVPAEWQTEEEIARMVFEAKRRREE